MTKRIPFETKDAPGEVTLDDVQKAIEAHAKATGETITKQADEIKSLRADLTEIEQKAADGLDHMPLGNTGLADELFKNDLIQQVAQKRTRDTSVEIKATSLLGLEKKNTITDNGGTFHNVSGPPSIFGGLERRRFIFDVLPKVVVQTGHVAYTRETAFTNNAAANLAGSPAVITEGVDKPESILTYETIDQRLSTTAHFIKASNQALGDVGQLGALIDGRLRYGLKVKVDAQIVTAMTTSGNYTAFVASSGDDGIASVNRAIAALELNDAMASLVLMNPATYRSLQRLRATGGDEQFLVGQPQGVNREALWGVTILPTNAVTAGKLLVVDVETFGTYFVREEARVDIGYVNDDFTKNLVTIRAEQRGDLAVIRPVSIQYGDLVL